MIIGALGALTIASQISGSMPNLMGAAGIGVDGMGRLGSMLGKVLVKMAVRSDGINERAVRRIADQIRATVDSESVDSGRLLNGISYWREGAAWIVQASAVNPRDGVNYAFLVDGGTVRMPAEPFFWDPINQAREERSFELENMVEGLDGE